MTKEKLFIIFNDTHLKSGNEDAVLVSVRHMINYAKDNGIKTIVFAGDLFHSRSKQDENCINTCDAIFSEIHAAGIHFIVFAGNHDKTSYYSHTSFLDVYRFHPNVTFTNKMMDIKIGKLNITLLPFFHDTLLVPMLEEHNGGDMLISHFEMKGSTHLGKVSEKSNITRKTLSKWNKTYLGHYHNTHEITPNIIHLPSLRQNDFGEDNLKGFTVIYDDGSYEIIKGVFKEFTKIVIDVDTVSTDDIKKLISEHTGSNDTIRFEFTGAEQKLKSLDKNLFDKTAIDVKFKYDKTFTFEKNEEAPKLIKKFDVENIEKAFESFCKNKELDYEKGKELLTKFLDKKKAA